MSEQKRTEEIKKLCKISRLSFSEEKLEELREHLTPLKELIKKIDSLTINEQEESQYFDVMRYEKEKPSPYTVMRPDVVQPCLKKEDIEKICPNFKNHYFVIPKAISEETF